MVLKDLTKKKGKVIAVYDCKFQSNSQTEDLDGAFATNNKNDKVTYLRFGVNNSMDIDIVAHEYTHSIEFAESEMIYKGESGAIMEAFSDIFGELVENAYNNFQGCDWVHHDKNFPRNIADPQTPIPPNIFKFPKEYKGLGWLPTDELTDNGWVHANSTVISHAAYVMTQNDDGFTELSTDELAKLWYEAMLLITNPDCSFAELRNYIESAAINIGLSEQKQARVSSVFEAAGIPCAKEKVAKNFDIYIVNPDDSEFYKTCVIEIEGTAREWINEFYQEKIVPEDIITNISLERGDYTLTVKNINSNYTLYWKQISVSNSYKKQNVIVYLDDIEDPTQETTIVPETTVTPETDIPETTAHVHDFVSSENAASCTGEGKIIHSCACGYSYTETLPIVEHNFINDVCSMCGFNNIKASDGLFFALNADQVSYSVQSIGFCKDTDIVIPSQYQGLPVTGVLREAFKKNTNITSVVFPDTMICINSWSFIGCSALEKVIFNEGLTEIQEYAFQSCTNLKEISFPKSIQKLGDGSFYGCSALSKITFNGNIPILSRNTFESTSIPLTKYGNGEYFGINNNPYYILMNLDASYEEKLHEDTVIIAKDAIDTNNRMGTITISNDIQKIYYNRLTNVIGRVEIVYFGTMVEWNSIEKDDIWNTYTVHCTDGEIKKS